MDAPNNGEDKATTLADSEPPDRLARRVAIESQPRPEIAADITVIVLDERLRLCSFTPPNKGLIDVIPSDVGRLLSDLSRKFADQRLIEDCRTALDRLTPIESEFAGDDGRVFMRRILPSCTVGDRTGGVVITYVDVTALKRAERAREAAEKANLIKDQFLARLSHELRTPLSSILTWAELLQHRQLSEEQLAEGLRVIERSALAQKQLLDDLLETARLSDCQTQP